MRRQKQMLLGNNEKQDEGGKGAQSHPLKHAHLESTQRRDKKTGIHYLTKRRQVVNLKD